MGAGGKEIPQSRRRLRNRIWPRDADCVEALRAGGVGESDRGRGRRQKSRLA
jgi:hypothetical protein